MQHRTPAPTLAWTRPPNGISLILVLVPIALSACSDVGISTGAICDGQLQGRETTVDSVFDVDGDGYFDGANIDCRNAYDADRLDCDDGDPGVHPGAVESVCNGVDDDCDSQTPDGVDEDGDGETACSDCNDQDPLLTTMDADGDGASTCTGDCDDADATRYPGATEFCDDGLDNSCNGFADCLDFSCSSDIACSMGGTPCNQGGFSILSDPGFESGVFGPDWYSDDPTTTVSAFAYDGAFAAETNGNHYVRQFLSSPVSAAGLLQATFWTWHDGSDAPAMAIYTNYTDGTFDSNCCFSGQLDGWVQFDVLPMINPNKLLENIQVWGYAGGGGAPDVTRFDLFEFCVP